MEGKVALKTFLIHSENVQRDSYIWNTAGSILQAFQSVILLMVLTRTVDLSESGIFTIAFANATLFMNLGKYGMRMFQVSDAKQQFTFEEYAASRCITVLLMILTCAIYDIYLTFSNHYTFEKSIIIFLMCIFKSADAVEDLFASQYQRENRLDVGAKLTTVRIGITTLFFGTCLVVMHDLLFSLILSTLFTYIMFFWMVRQTNELFGKTVYCSRGFVIKNQFAARSLLRICFPLCASAFLSYYLGNASKYAIDSILNDELQACYGFISLPVSVVGLLGNFIFYPILYYMTQLWMEGEIHRFIRRTLIQAGIVFIITLGCIAACFVFGVPILSFIYHTDLSPYKRELMVLMVGGGFWGLIWLLNQVITIIRYQKQVLWVYAGVSLMALLLSGKIVQKFALMGAAVSYTVWMGILCIGLVVIFIIGIIKGKQPHNR